MAVHQMAGYSSDLLQNDCSSTSYSAAYPYSPLGSTTYCSPELVIRLLRMQISSYFFLNQFKHHTRVVKPTECCIRRSEKLQHQYNNNSSCSSTMASDVTFTPRPVGSSLVTTVWLKKFNNDGCKDGKDQDSPDDDEDPTTAMPGSLNTLRFACHFHKRAPSRYCAAGCRYTTCEDPGWENIFGVK